MATVSWTRADVIRRQTFQGSPRLSREVSLPCFSPFFAFLTLVRTGCSVEFTVADTVGFFNLKDVSYSICNFQHYGIYNELNKLKKEKEKNRDSVIVEIIFISTA